MSNTPGHTPTPGNNPAPKQPDPAERLAFLADAYLHGELSPEGLAELEALIQTDPAAAERFIAFTEQSGMMREVFTNVTDQLIAVEDSETDDFLSILSELDAPEGEPPAPIDFTAELARREMEAKEEGRCARRLAQKQQAFTEQSRPTVISKTAVVLAVAAMLGLIAWLGWPEATPHDSADRTAQQKEDDVPRTAAPATNVAFIRSSIDARWVGMAYDHNHYLRGGKTVTLREGLAEIVFGDGAAVIVQGPATFEPVGPNAMRLDTGRIVATVSESAHGFTVATAGGLITDYGTEFGVHVHTDGQTLAQTFTGRIGLSPTDGGNEVGLRAGDAVVAAPSGRVRRVEHVALNNTAFVRQAEYDAHQSADDSPYHRWLAYSYTLRRDPAMLAYYTFDNRAEAPDLLINRASRTQGRYDGLLGIDHDAMTAPRWTEGRFPEKEAMRFGVIGDGMARAVQIDGLGGRDLGETLTIAVWLQVPPEEAETGGGTLLSLRDAPVRHIGFQFSMFLEGDPYSNQLQFGTGNELVVAHPNENFRYTAYTPAQVGSWALVVVVYEAGRATFYHNGHAVGTTEDVGPLATTRPETPLLIGTDPSASNAQNPRQVEAFMGAIDEVLILERAMSAEEIDQMYQAGNPSSH